MVAAAAAVVGVGVVMAAAVLDGQDIFSLRLMLPPPPPPPLLLLLLLLLTGAAFVGVRRLGSIGPVLSTKAIFANANAEGVVLLLGVAVLAVVVEATLREGGRERGREGAGEGKFG